MKIIFSLIFALALCGAYAQQKVALVIGNNDYQEYPLKNAANDADLMTKTLQSLGFTVVQVKNATKTAFDRALLNFNRDYKNAAIRFFYYAGHGIQFEGENYLVPTDAVLENQEDIKIEGINFSTITSMFQNSKADAMNVFVLDACRNNPFKSRSWGSRSEGGDRGLVLKKEEFHAGSFAAFSADNGQKASDGDQGNGLYTSVLAEEIQKQGVEINIVFQRVRNRVYTLSNGLQLPVEENRLVGDGFYFMPPVNNQPAVTPTVVSNPVMPPTPTPGPAGLQGMVLVQGGTFSMGSSEEADEKPVHNVTVSSFYISKLEVTVAEFKQFIDATGYETTADRDGWSEIWVGTDWKKQTGLNWRTGVDGNRLTDDQMDRPVMQVSWYDAVKYCEWKSGVTGRKYRLPTEAEWEYAARGGNKAMGYNYSGSNDANTVEWNNANSNGDTHPVGVLLPNELGLYDMTGNVSEWCSDLFGSYNQSAVTNPKGPESGTNRVFRGGSFNSPPIRVAYRGDNKPETHLTVIGFRLACEL